MNQRKYRPDYMRQADPGQARMPGCQVEAMPNLSVVFTLIVVLELKIVVWEK